MKKLNMRTVWLGLAFILVLAVLCFFIGFFFSERTSNSDHIMPPAAENGTTEVPTATAPVLTTSPLVSGNAQVPANSTSVNILENDDIVPLPEAVTISINENEWYLTLVNDWYKMPADYEVVSANAAPGSDVKLDYRVAEAYTAMYNAAAADGLYLTPYSGLRSYSRQEINYENKTQLYLSQGYNETEARALAAMVIKPPGCSEHNLGLAMDIIDTADNFYTTKEYAWLMENATDYGFILRYPKEKQYITRVEYEPWHWRYVGVEHAKAIKASGLCLEEYLQAIGKMPVPLAQG